MTMKPIAVEMPGAVSGDGEEVTVRVFKDYDGERHAYVVPRSLQNLGPKAEGIVAAVQAVARERMALDDQLEYLIGAGRAEGLSWNALGWCLGVTGDAVRKAYGDEPR